MYKKHQRHGCVADVVDSVKGRTEASATMSVVRHESLMNK